MDHNQFPHFDSLQEHQYAGSALVATAVVTASGCLLLLVLIACHHAEVREVAAQALRRGKSPLEKVV
eukprot:SAG31_NODE_1179_length_9530_cov_8.153748_14_plen_67_part_00